MADFVKVANITLNLDHVVGCERKPEGLLVITTGQVQGQPNPLVNHGGSVLLPWTVGFTGQEADAFEAALNPLNAQKTYGPLRGIETPE